MWVDVTNARIHPGLFFFSSFFSHSAKMGLWIRIPPFSDSKKRCTAAQPENVTQIPLKSAPGSFPSHSGVKRSWIPVKLSRRRHWNNSEIMVIIPFTGQAVDHRHCAAHTLCQWSRTARCRFERCNWALPSPPPNPQRLDCHSWKQTAVTIKMMQDDLWTQEGNNLTADWIHQEFFSRIEEKTFFLFLQPSSWC